MLSPAKLNPPLTLYAIQGLVLLAHVRQGVYEVVKAIHG
jgi:hypothetical protein